MRIASQPFEKFSLRNLYLHCFWWALKILYKTEKRSWWKILLCIDLLFLEEEMWEGFMKENIGVTYLSKMRMNKVENIKRSYLKSLASSSPCSVEIKSCPLDFKSRSLPRLPWSWSVVNFSVGLRYTNSFFSWTLLPHFIEVPKSIYFPWS